MIEYFLMALFVSADAGPGAAGSDPANARKPDGGVESRFGDTKLRQPVEIKADNFEYLGKKQQATWSGSVHAKRGTTDLYCDKLTAFIVNGQEISRIECVGGVEVSDGDKWAKGQRADFDNLKGIIEITGSPQARQGPNKMKGRKVIIDLPQDIIRVEGVEALFDSTPQGVKPAPPSGKKK